MFQFRMEAQPDNKIILFNNPPFTGAANKAVFRFAAVKLQHHQHFPGESRVQQRVEDTNSLIVNKSELHMPADTAERSGNVEFEAEDN